MLATNRVGAAADFSKGIHYLLVLVAVLIAFAAVIIAMTRKKRIVENKVEEFIKEKNRK
jgi:hypothetical protein